MKRLILLGISLFFGLFSGLHAQEEPSFTVSAPERVVMGRPFDISFNINTKGSRAFTPPSFHGLDVIFGPSQSQSTSIQFINGESFQSFSLTYSYRVQALQAGEITIEPASIEIKGETYQTQPITILVTEEQMQGSAPSSSASTPSSSNSHSTHNAMVTDEELFIKSKVNKKTAYVGEEIILSNAIYTSVPVGSFQIGKTPSYKHFWNEDLKISNEQKSQNINGKRYLSAEINKQALYAQKEGKLRLEPLEVEAIAQIQVQRQRSSGSIFDIFDDPFFDRVQNVKKVLRSDPIYIQVKPLPAHGRPQSFTGLVGNYKMTFSYNTEKTFKANEAITFTLTIKGEGNIDMIQAPAIVFPPDFEVYEPKITQNKNNTASGISGEVKYEYIVVPRSSGIYKIHPFEFSFFNPKTAQYVTQTSDEIILDIASGATQFSGSSPNSHHLHSIEQDIEYIQLYAGDFKNSRKQFFLSPWFFILCLFPVACYFLVAFLIKKKQLANQDIVGIKNKRAMKEASKSLKKANKCLLAQQKEEFYIEISQALWGFLSDKLNIPTAQLSMDTIEATLTEKNLDSDLILEFIDTLKLCEFERFAPSEKKQENMESLYQKALDIIFKIAKELK